MKPVLAAVLFVALAVSLAGCALQDGYRAVGQINAISKHNDLTAQKKYPEALAIARQLVDDPPFNDDLNKTNYRIIALNDLAQVAAQEGKVGFWVDAEYDALARNWMGEGIAMTVSSKTDQFGWVMASYANYLDLTGRKGESIFYRIAGTRALASKAPKPALSTARQAADAADQIGDTGLAQLARTNFWNTFVAINPTLSHEDRMSLIFTDLVPAIDSTAGPAEADVDQLWLPLERIETEGCKIDDCSGLLSIPRMSVAKAYARRGFAERARALRAPALRYADKHLKDDGIALVHTMGQCLDVQIAVADHRDAAVPPAYDACKAAIAAAGGQDKLGLTALDRWFDLDLALAAGEARLKLGRPVEAAADFGAAITLIERQRAIYDVGQLDRFFGNSRNRRAYTGMLLAQVAASGKAFDAAARDRILNVAELTRARQLREMRARRAGQVADAAAFDVEAYLRDSPRIGRLIRSLPPRAALLYYVVLEDRTIAIVVDAKGQDIVTLKPGARDLTLLVDAATAKLASGSDLAGTDAALAELSRAILDPVESRLRLATSLYVVPDDSLNRIPFAALGLGAKKRVALIDSRSIYTLPALDLLQGPSGVRSSNRLLALGDPVYPDLTAIVQSHLPQGAAADASTRAAVPFLPQLPDTRDEVVAIGNRFTPQTREILLGDQASETRFKQEPLETFRYIHLATHGMIGGDIPGVNEPSLALGASARDDGLLRMSEVVALKLDARLTVLSACNTGSGQVVAGEGVLGMGRAFLVAGSDSVVMSLWPVASRETAELMTDFYGRLATTPQTADALRASMLAVRAKHPHPFFWAPFVVMGRG